MNEREKFEEKFGKPHHWIEFDESKNKYVCKHNAIDHHLLIRQAQLEAWQVRVPAGCVVVPREPTFELLEALQEGFEFAYEESNYCSHAGYKAMIEAGEK